MKRHAAVSVALASALLISACGTSEDEPASTGSAQAAELTVGYSLPVPNNDSLNAMAETIKATLGAGNVTVTYANQDANKQISDVDSLIQRGVDVLIVFPVDSKSINAAVERAKDAGIPVIGQEVSAGQLDLYSLRTLTDNEAAAEEAAQYLAQIGATKVGAIAPIPVADVFVARDKGFKAGAEKAGLQVLDSQPNTDLTSDTARKIAQSWKERYGSGMTGLWAYNETAALAALSVVDESFKPTVVSMNGAPSEIDAIRAGRLAATWDVVPVPYAKMLAYAAQQLQAKAGLPAQEVHIMMPRIDKTNVGSWKDWDSQRGDAFDVRFETKGGVTYLVNPAA